jgi:hypothetical protein
MYVRHEDVCTILIRLESVDCLGCLITCASTPFRRVSTVLPVRVGLREPKCLRRVVPDLAPYSMTEGILCTLEDVNWGTWRTWRYDVRCTADLFSRLIPS